MIICDDIFDSACLSFSFAFSFASSLMLGKAYICETIPTCLLKILYQFFILTRLLILYFFAYFPFPPKILKAASKFSLEVLFLLNRHDYLFCSLWYSQSFCWHFVPSSVLFSGSKFCKPFFFFFFSVCPASELSYIYLPIVFSVSLSTSVIIFAIDWWGSFSYYLYGVYDQTHCKCLKAN